VWALEAGGLVNAFGNGFVYPFLFIYLHNVRGFSLGTSCAHWPRRVPSRPRRE
jgi:hypothetical protein